MKNDTAIEQEPAQWKEMLNRGGEHTLHLMRGNYQMVVLRCVDETPKDGHASLYIEDLKILNEEGRRNLGIARKTLKKIKELATAIEAKRVRWVVTSSETMRNLSQTLRDAGLAIEQNPASFYIPTERLDQRVILALLKNYNKKEQNNTL